MIKSLKYTVFEILSRIDKTTYLRRQEPIYSSFCIHSERIYDDRIFVELIDFVKYYSDTTGKRITLCATTPISHGTKSQLKRHKAGEDLYAERLEKLNKECVIGYHGHFYIKKGQHQIPVKAGNFDRDLVYEQIEREINWFNERGIAPTRYTAGWWFINKDILLKLQSHGFLLDFSINYKRTNTFGELFAEKDKIPPVGDVFSMQGTDGLLEIQSVFGPTSHPYRIKKISAPFIGRNTSNKMYFCFPLHDWDILDFKRELINNIKGISMNKDYISWTDFSPEEIRGMRERRKIIEIWK